MIPHQLLVVSLPHSHLLYCFQPTQDEYNIQTKPPLTCVTLVKPANLREDDSFLFDRTTPLDPVVYSLTALS